jgi:hypothetical protein
MVEGDNTATQRLLLEVADGRDVGVLAVLAVSVVIPGLL